jgi:hypothetical protein
MVDVFISYARDDRSQAAELAQLLEGRLRRVVGLEARRRPFSV